MKEAFLDTTPGLIRAAYVRTSGKFIEVKLLEGRGPFKKGETVFCAPYRFVRIDSSGGHDLPSSLRTIRSNEYLDYKLQDAVNVLSSSTTEQTT